MLPTEDSFLMTPPARTAVPSATASVTPAPTSMPTTTPTPALTPVPPALILADFPLALGATWKYAAEFSYQNPSDFSKLVTWSGSVTDKVVKVEIQPDGRIVFTIREDLEPIPPQGVWRQSRTVDYTLSGDGIFEAGLKIYQWPLSDKLTWTAIADSGYEINVEYIGSVHVPYGEMNSCYVFSLFTNPDDTHDTFCPGIGFVEHSYRHHGTPQDERFTLISYEPGR